jgi:hypothetical protein
VSSRVPLVLDDKAAVQQLQRQDGLDPDKTKLTGQSDFQQLQQNFRLLLFSLTEQGFSMPAELQKEMEQYAC